ncbi:MAG: prepilin-type N-terminal cleavage/methylation domain-containing protein [Acidobacteria bacterium]|nr:prepilin-type N-terminal cleavage/methylation domain-containing protein [Acidobacteriota bacterium]
MRRCDGAVRDERGFTMVEMLIAAGITGAVVGGAIMMATSVQRVYSYELNDAAVQQEARFALDWITRTIAAAGSNPYDITVTVCPTAGTFQAIRLDPDLDGDDDDIRVQADVNPPNGVLVDSDVSCDAEDGEDVTIAHDPDAMTITREDAALDDAPVPVTDGIFTDLQFTYLDTNRAATTNASAVIYVQVSVTAQSRARNPYTGDYTTYTYQTEVRVRGR